MKDIRFYPALFVGKILMEYYKYKGLERSDHSGMASMRICPDFLKYVKKPAVTLAVTGTNGKTSTSSMITDILRKDGKSVSYNDWGANHHAGHARCLLPTVNILNNSIMDAAVIEMDELISPINVPDIKPEYMIISNLGRDSMLRNAQPYYIRSKIQKATELCPETKLIINADNPLCYDIGNNSKKIYFGVADLSVKSSPTLIDDFPICPRCGSKPVYEYRNHRHIGSYKCSECDFKRPDCDYFVESVDPDKKFITMREPNGTYIYPVNSVSVYNIYNYASIIVLFREMGMSADVLASYLKEIYPPVSRETEETIGDITVKTLLCKGQNVSAASTSFECVKNTDGKKCVVLLVDELFDNKGEMETSAWIYDTDYELLNSEDIVKIVVAGDRYKDQKIRLLMAGIPEERFVCVKDFREANKYVPTKDIDTVFVLHDVNFVTNGKFVAEQIKNNIRESKNADRSFVS